MTAAQEKAGVAANNLSDAMLRVLRNLVSGRSPGLGLSGRAAYGGLHRTARALRKRGYMDGWEITEAGRDAFAKAVLP